MDEVLAGQQQRLADLKKKLDAEWFTEEEISDLVQELVWLSKEFPEIFQDVLKTNLLNRPNRIPLMQQLLPELESEGWTELGRSGIFEWNITSYWRIFEACREGLHWREIYPNAKALLVEWKKFIEKKIQEQTRIETLYNPLFNYLMDLSICELDTYEAYVGRLESLVKRLSDAMQKWYPSITKQRYVLFAFLSQVELMHYVWLNQEQVYQKQLPTEIGKWLWELCEDYRYLWNDTNTEDETKKDISTLKDWAFEIAQ